MKSKVLAALAALGITLVGFVVVGEPTQAKGSGTTNGGTNASPHFLPTSFQVAVDTNSASPDYGDARVQYDVAGMGNGGRVYIRVRGKLSVEATCYKRNQTWYKSFLDHDVRVNEHVATANKWGNYRGDDMLRKSAICPGGAVSFTLDHLSWDNIGADLMDYWDHTLVYDTWENTQPVGSW